MHNRRSAPSSDPFGSGTLPFSCGAMRSLWCALRQAVDSRASFHVARNDSLYVQSGNASFVILRRNPERDSDVRIDRCLWFGQNLRLARLPDENSGKRANGRLRATAVVCRTQISRFPIFLPTRYVPDASHRKAVIFGFGSIVFCCFLRKKCLFLRAIGAL